LKPLVGEEIYAYRVGMGVGVKVNVTVGVKVGT
jgi:hypothetical protein